MKKILLFTLLSITTSGLKAQTYTANIQSYRQKYKQEFLEDKRSPLKADDTGYLRFYAADPAYNIKAKFTPTPDSKPFLMSTHSGRTKTYRQYGVITFMLPDDRKNQHKPHQLSIYQSQDLMKDTMYRDYLFIPFNDLTNGTDTYGGGRYLDIKTSDISNGYVMIDFNKGYNPYCAFADGYNCPIPPVENRLDIAIPAGEKKFGKNREE